MSSNPFDQPRRAAEVARTTSPDRTPSRSHYDVVVVGARVAGAPAAMLLARAGLRVLLVDRQRRGADTLSTHALMRGGVLQLHRWGLLDGIVADGTPAITEAGFFYGDRVVRLPIAPDGPVRGLYAPRRTLLDPVLVEAAEQAGAEAIHGVRVVDLVRGRHDRVTGVELAFADTRVRVGAHLVIGADGINSFVARKVDAATYRTGSGGAAAIYAYVRGLPDPTYDSFFAPGVAAGVIPTNDGLVCVFVSMPSRRFAAEARRDVADAWWRVLAEARGELAAALADAELVAPFRSFPGRPGHFRISHGAGWALVGDAGHYNDSLTAHGITAAFRDAELLAGAVLDDDLERYQCSRDELSVPIFEVTERIASFGWSLDELQAQHIALSRAFKREAETVAAWEPALAPRQRELVPCG